MQDSTIAIIILCATIVLYISDKLPLSVATMLAVIAMGITGVLPWDLAFSGFSSVTTLMIVGMLIMGEAFFAMGFAESLGHSLLRFSHLGEKKMLLILFVVAGITSIFFNGTVIMAVLMPVIDTMAMQSNGVITRKGLYLSTAIGTVLGANLSIIGSSSMLLSVNTLRESTGIQMAMFEPALVSLPAFAAGFLIYLTFGYRFQQRCLDFPDRPPRTASSPEAVSEEHPRWRKAVCLATFGVCMICFLIQVADMAAISIIGAAVLLGTGCIRASTAYHNLSWDTIIVVGGSIGFAAGIEHSGAAQVIADGILDLMGENTGPFALCVVIMFISTLLSNVLSNTSTVAILMPITLIMASSFGANPIPFTMAVAVGANLSLATPISVATVTMTMIAGYRFKDFARIGGLINVVTFVVTVAAMKVVYF